VRIDANAMHVSNLFSFKRGPPAVELQSINLPSSVFTRSPHVEEPRSIISTSSPFTDCEPDSLASVDSVAASNSNYEKVGLTSSALPIRDST